MQKIDYKQKAEEIIKKLNENIFGKINIDEYFEPEYDEKGNVKGKKRKAVSLKKNQIMPALSPTSVNACFEGILRSYMPLSYGEAKMYDPQDFLSAYSEFCKIITHINEYLIFKMTKPHFCAFCGITTDTYNMLAQDVVFTDVIKWLNDSFASSIFVDSASGLYNSAAVINEGQTKDVGLNMVKNPEAVVFTNNQFINTKEIERQLRQFEQVAKIPSPKSQK